MKIQKYFLLQNKKLKPWIKYWLFIKSKVSKNIFDVDNPTVIDAFVNGSSGLLASPTNRQKSFVVKVKPNTTYQITGVERSSSNYGFFNNEILEINVSIATIKANISNGSAILTSGQNSKWLVFLWKGGAETYGYSNIVIKEV